MDLADERSEMEMEESKPKDWKTYRIAILMESRSLRGNILGGTKDRNADSVHVTRTRKCCLLL